MLHFFVVLVVAAYIAFVVVVLAAFSPFLMHIPRIVRVFAG